MTTNVPFLTEEQKKARLEWAEALKSGSFAQGQSHMLVERCDGTKTYCCLGVAGTIFDGEFAHLSTDGDYTAYGLFEDLGDDNNTTWTDYLPEDLIQKLGMTDDETYACVHLNDTKRWDFDAIGDVVERSAVEDRPINKIVNYS